MSNDLNASMHIGTVVADSELSYTQSGIACAKFTLAVNKEYYKDDEKKSDVSFFDFIIWNKKAESLNQYITKGKKICVTSESKQDRWTTEDGSKRSRITFVVDKLQFLSASKKENTDTTESVSESNIAAPNMPFSEEDIPF